MNILKKMFETVMRWVGKRHRHRVTLYYAVNKGGQGFLFVGEPSRDSQAGKWVGETSVDAALAFIRMEALGFVLPKLSWPDEPVRLKLTLEHEA